MCREKVWGYESLLTNFENCFDDIKVGDRIYNFEWNGLYKVIDIKNKDIYVITEDNILLKITLNKEISCVL